MVWTLKPSQNKVPFSPSVRPENPVHMQTRSPSPMGWHGHWIGPGCSMWIVYRGGCGCLTVTLTRAPSVSTSKTWARLFKSQWLSSVNFFNAKLVKIMIWTTQHCFFSFYHWRITHLHEAVWGDEDGLSSGLDGQVKMLYFPAPPPHVWDTYACTIISKLPLFVGTKARVMITRLLWTHNLLKGSVKCSAKGHGYMGWNSIITSTQSLECLLNLQSDFVLNR
jgi:hypothetical protein